jgi:hypothetical protein
MKSHLHLESIDKAIEKIDEEQNCVEIKEKPKDIYETNRDIVFVMEPDIADKINEDTLEANFSEVWEENHENIDIKLEQLESAESFDARKFDPLLDQNYEKKNESFVDGLMEYVDINYESVHERKKQDVNQCNFNVQEKKSLENKINTVHDYEKIGKIQISSEDTEYKCSLCEFESDNKKTTVTHIHMVHEEKKHNFIAKEPIVGEKNSLDNKINAVHDEKQSGFNAQISFEKPQMTYDQLIEEALINSSNGLLVVSDIYKAICSKHPYYKKAGRSWQIKVKHALVSYKKFEKAGETSQGFYWKLV